MELVMLTELKRQFYELCGSLSVTELAFNERLAVSMEHFIRRILAHGA